MKKVVLLAKTKLNSTEILISKALIDSSISLMVNLFNKECAERIKNKCYRIAWSVEKIQKENIQNIQKTQE